MQIAELVDRTLAGVGVDSPQICSLPEAHNAVVQALGVRIAFARLSKNNAAPVYTEFFYVNDLEYDITDLIGNGQPIGAEIKEETRYVALRLYRLCDDGTYGMGEARFEQRTDESSGETRQFIRFPVIPQKEVRVAYTSGAVQTHLEADAQIPDSIGELIVLEAQNILIPRIQLKYQINLNRSEQDRRDAQMIVSTYNNVLASNITRIAPLLKLWEIWAFKNRKQKFGKRPTPRSSHLYGSEHY